jgi:hypothetical protein
VVPFLKTASGEKGPRRLDLKRNAAREDVERC